MDRTWEVDVGKRPSAVVSDMLTGEEVAALAGCTPSNIRHLRRKANMPAATRVGRQWMWPRAVIEEWIPTRRRCPAPSINYQPQP